jgi:glutamate--cysteine ligase
VGDTPFKAFNQGSIKQLEHVLSMVFPDVRLKKYLEIRQMDALPYPLNFSVIALWKGLLYHEDNLNILSNFIDKISLEEVIEARQSVVKNGINSLYVGRPLLDLMFWLLELAQNGLTPEEKAYLQPLIDLIKAGKTPKQLSILDKNYMMITPKGGNSCE